MLEYDPHYPTILPPGIALALVFVLNILAPLLAIFVARRMKRRRWMSHAVAFLWVLLSTFVLGELALPTTAPDERPDLATDSSCFLSWRKRRLCS